MGEMPIEGETFTGRAEVEVSVQVLGLPHRATAERVKVFREQRKAQHPEACREGLRQVLTMLGMMHRYEAVVRTVDRFLLPVMESHRPVTMTCRGSRDSTSPTPVGVLGQSSAQPGESDGQSETGSATASLTVSIEWEPACDTTGKFSWTETL